MVQIRTNKQRFTATLALTAGGQKLPLYAAFKSKTVAKEKCL